MDKNKEKTKDLRPRYILDLLKTLFPYAAFGAVLLVIYLIASNISFSNLFGGKTEVSDQTGTACGFPGGCFCCEKTDYFTGNKSLYFDCYEDCASEGGRRVEGCEDFIDSSCQN